MNEQQEQLKLIQTDTEVEQDIFDMTQYNSRKGYCPVREMDTTEYEMPLSRIQRLPRVHQPRVQDCSETSVIEKAEQMKSPKGQTTGICVFGDEADGRPIFTLGWGNTRFRGGHVLDARGENIFNCKKGHIWVTLYEHAIVDLKLYQAIENNVHDINERATPEDNLKSILDMIDEGRIPGYADLDQEKQRKEVKKLYNDCKMPAHKFQSLWNQVIRKNIATSRKRRTWDKNEIARYWGNNNDYGVAKELCKNIHESGEVFDVTVDGVVLKIALYMASKTSELGGATLANAQWKRNVNEECDEVVLVVSLNDIKGKNLDESRQKMIDKINRWNPHTVAGKSIDRILFVPQTEDEQVNELIEGAFLMDTKF